MSRSRSRGSFTNSTLTRGSSYNGVQDAPLNDSLPNGNGKMEWMTDETGKKFYDDQRDGKLTIRPCTREEHIRTAGSGGYQNTSTYTPVREHHGTGDIFGFFTARMTASYFDSSSIIAQAAQSGQANVVPASALSLVSLAELKKTKEMFVEAGKLALSARGEILKIYNRYKRDLTIKKAKRDAYSLADAASSYWLQARYGWMPLYYDIKGHVAAFSKEAKRLPWLQARGTASASFSNTQSLTAGYSGWGGYVGFTYDIVRTADVVVRTGVYFEDQASRDFRVMSDLGLTLNHLPSVVYELTYMSFVLDWFIDVGTWLQAIAPKPGIRYLGAWTSETQRLTSRKVLTGSFQNPGTQATASFWSSDELLNAKRYRRVQGIQHSIFPASGTGLSTIRSISAAALSFQQLKRLLPHK